MRTIPPLEEIMSEAKQSGKNANGVQAQFGKTDSRYWKTRVVKAKGRNFYGVQIASNGERHYLALGTANRDDAAAAAARIFLRIKVEGWKAVLETVRPQPARKVATVGDYITKAEELARVEPRTVNEYKKALRRLVSEIKGIGGEGRFDWRSGKADEWRAKVDAVRLDTITEAEVLRWKKRKIAECADPLKQSAAKNTINGVIRNAKALFGKKVLPYVSAQLEVPDPHPLKGVDLFPRQSMRYSSKIDPATVIDRAVAELATPRELTAEEIDKYIADYVKTMSAAHAKRRAKGEFILSDERRASLPEEARAYHRQREASRREQFKIFTLALFAGLRFNEIDKLLWRQVNLDRAVIAIETTEHFRPKTQEASGEVSIDPELVALLRGWKAKAVGEFVVEAGRESRSAAQWSAYRTRTHQKALLDWLRDLEIDGAQPLKNVQKPIHELRKEAGSLINEQSGLFAASVFLRHSDTRVTAAHYVDAKRGITTGLGSLLAGGNVVPFADGGRREGAA